MDGVEEQVPRPPSAASPEVVRRGGATTAELGSDRPDGRSWMQRVGAWRQGIRSRPSSHRIYRIVVGLIGGAIVIGGLLAIPFPGPGWLIVFLGLAVLGSEFAWAARLNEFTKSKVKAWSRWLGRQPLLIRVLVTLAICAFVVGIVYALFALTGVPGWVPDSWVDWVPGLGP